MEKAYTYPILPGNVSSEKRERLMYIKEVHISNYKSFHEEHIFRFHRGANIVMGGGGSGKTNLCGAIEFALFGGMPRGGDELSGLINVERVGEGKTERLWVGCEVRLIFEDVTGEHRVERDFSLFDDDEASERLHYSKRLTPKISQGMYREMVYIGEVPGASDDSEFSAESVEEHLLGLAERNVDCGVGMMILDDVFDRLPSVRAEDALSRLLGSGLDQVILLVDELKPVFEGAKLYRLGKTIESVIFEVEGSPFDPSRLKRDIELTVRDSYVARGDLFKKDVYGHECTIEAVQVTPDGARYQADKSNLTIL